MLAELLRLKRELPLLIANSETDWQTLDVLYEEPRVERVWLQVGDHRLYLHRIHPCEKPFYHPHPWPSAIMIVDGKQTMAVGYGPPDGPSPPVATTLSLARGSAYEMLDPYGWHSVNPQGGPSYSLMVSGVPWATSLPSRSGKGGNRPLSPEVKEALLHHFYGY